MEIGQTFTVKKSITDKLIVDFSEISGDRNPLHLDEDYAKNTIFKKRIAHGMLIGSFFSSVLANDFPGEGTIYLSQKLDFKAPVYIDTQVSIELQILEIKKEKKLFIIRTDCLDENGKILVTGEAVVMNKNINF